MNGWEGEPDTHARRPRNGADRSEPRGGADPDDGSGGARTDDARVADASDGGPHTATPDAVAPTGLGLVPPGERGIDPFPSTGSLVWAPDATQSVPLQPSDPPSSAPAGPDWPAPSGEPLSATGHQRSPSPADAGQHVARVYPDQVMPPRSPAYRDQPPRAARRGSRRSQRAASGHAPRSLRTDRLALGALGVVLVVVVAAFLLVPDGDGSEDPEQPTSGSAPLVGGDATDPAGPIVGTTGVIGSWSGSEWLPRQEGEQPGAGLEYAVLGLGDAFPTVQGEAAEEDCAAEAATSDTDVVVDLEETGDSAPAIAVAGVADPRPRPVEQLSTDAPVYLQAATDVAAGLGATTPPTLTQLLRADVDGDGTDEIVVAAEHIVDRSGLSPAAGDWSVVFLRRVATGGVATDVLASSVVGGGGTGPSGGDRLERIQVATLADLNRDGAMEVALVGRSEAGAWTAIHAVGADGAPSEVLRAGCES